MGRHLQTLIQIRVTDQADDLLIKSFRPNKKKSVTIIRFMIKIYNVPDEIDDAR